MTPGYIYIMQHRQLNKEWIKIGRTKNLNRRARSLAGSALMSEFNVRASFACRNTVAAEKMVFRILTPYRIQGNREFFDAPIEHAIGVCEAVIEHLDLGKDLDPEKCFPNSYLEQLMYV